MTKSKDTASALLVVILVTFALLATTYSLVTKLKYGPDEPAHFIYVRALALNHAPPPIAHTETPDESYEASHAAHHPPLYYAIAAISYALLDWAGASQDIIWRVLRLLNVVIGAAWIYTIYLLALVCFGDRRYAVATAGLVALIPNCSYTAGMIINDPLIALLFTAALIHITGSFKSGRPPASPVLLGVLMGLAILTKAQGLALIPVFILSQILICRRSEYTNWREVGKSTAIVLGCAILVSGWWFARSMVVHGTPLPQSLNRPVITNMLIMLFTPVVSAELVYVASKQLYGHFWVPYWLVGPVLGSWKYFSNTVLAVTAVVLVGAISKLRRSSNIDRRSLYLLVFAAVLIYLLWLRHALVVDRFANLQGRLLMPVAGAIGIVFVLGFDNWLRSPLVKKIGAGVATAVLLIMNFVVIGCAVTLYR